MQKFYLSCWFRSIFRLSKIPSSNISYFSALKMCNAQLIANVASVIFILVFLQSVDYDPVWVDFSARINDIVLDRVSKPGSNDPNGERNWSWSGSHFFFFHRPWTSLQAQFGDPNGGGESASTGVQLFFFFNSWRNLIINFG